MAEYMTVDVSTVTVLCQRGCTLPDPRTPSPDIRSSGGVHSRGVPGIPPRWNQGLGIPTPSKGPGTRYIHSPWKGPGTRHAYPPLDIRPSGGVHSRGVYQAYPPRWNQGPGIPTSPVPLEGTWYTLSSCNLIGGW